MKKKYLIISIFILIIFVFFVKAYQLLAMLVYCQDLFPGNCIVGGCDADAGWYTAYCVIYCSQTSAIVCRPAGWYF